MPTNLPFAEPLTLISKFAIIANYGLKTGSLKNLVSEAELAQARREGWLDGSLVSEAELAQARREASINILQQLADLGVLKKEILPVLFKGKDYTPEIKFPTR